MKTIACLFFICAFGANAGAQETDRDGSDEPSLEILAPTIGSFVQEIVNEKTSLVPKRMVGRREITRRWILGKKFIEERGVTRFPGLPQAETLAVLSFDEQQGVFRWWNFDTFGVASELVGSWNRESRAIEWKLAKPRADGYSHSVTEHVGRDGMLKWEAQGRRRDGTLAVHQQGKSLTSPESQDQPTKP